jgi:hypothetical protein
VVYSWTVSWQAFLREFSEDGLLPGRDRQARTAHFFLHLSYHLHRCFPIRVPRFTLSSPMDKI